MYLIISGIAVLGWGIWCIIAGILNKRAQMMHYPDDEFLVKRILGKHYDKVMNYACGIILVGSGLFIFYTVLFK
jgi:hypothetical protein